MSRAMTPPTRKNANEVIRYMSPICFASVVRRTRAIMDPGTDWRTGHGRVTIGFGSTAVMLSSGRRGYGDQK